MTCIATDGKTMAADGQMCAADLIVSEKEEKMFKLDDGSVVGCSGCASSIIIVRKWFEAGEPLDELPALVKEEDGVDFAALILRADGIVEWMGEDFCPVPYAVPTAIGSGDEIAIGAMEGGSSPEEAVQIAARRISTVGGKIVVLRPGS